MRTDLAVPAPAGFSEIADLVIPLPGPITLFGVGPREWGYLWFLQHIGIAQTSGVAYGILWFLVIVANSLIGGAVFLASGARLPRLRAAR